MEVTAGKAPGSAVVIKRGNSTFPFNGDALQACDVVHLQNLETTVRVTLADGRRIKLDRRTPSRRVEIPCNERGVLRDLWAILRAAAGASDARAERTAAMTSRGDEAAQANLPLAVPMFGAPSAQIVEGSRNLYLRWVGGKGPFVVTLRDKGTTQVIVQRSAIVEREISLPVKLAPGTYEVEIGQAPGQEIAGIAEDSLVVVPASELPASPLDRAGSGLPSAAATLFYADHLVALDDGKWTLEATQMVAGLRPQTIASRDWLARHAGAIKLREPKGAGPGLPLTIP